MDLDKVLAQLREELENLDAAIASLERLQTEGPRRGRPPKLPGAGRKTDTDLRSVRDHRPG
jgi:BMFP domain-containing protein YqiC